MRIRTWNVFHGNTKPTQRQAFVREAVELGVADGPDVVCLQELPAWSLSRLAAWSGYTASAALAAPPMLGPLWSTAGIGRAVSSLDAGLLRSAFSGQANAILVARHLHVLEEHECVLNTRSFRRAQSEWLGLGVAARLGWAKERRVCQAVRLTDGELLRAFVYVDGLAQPGEPVAVAGDFNITFERSRTLLDLTDDDWGFSRADSGIDHVLVRNLDLASGPTRMAPELRMVNGAPLSDHAPVDVVVE